MDIKLKKFKLKKHNRKDDKTLSDQSEENESQDNNEETDINYDELKYDYDKENQDNQYVDLDKSNVESENDELENQDEKYDTVKSKDNGLSSYGSNYLKNLLVGFIIVILAFITFCSYGKIKEVVKHNNTEIYSINIGGSDILNEYTNVLYKNYVMSSDQNIENYEDIFIDKYSDNEEFNQNAKTKLKDNIDSWEKSIKKDYKNIDYVMIDGNGKKVMSNTDDYMYDAYKKNDIDSVTDIYEWYEVVEYDGNGNYNIANTNGDQSSYYIRSIGIKSILNSDYNKYYGNNTGVTNQNNTDENRITVKPIKNVTFIYGIKKNLAYKDEVSKLVTDEQYSIGGGNNENVINIIICIIVIAIIISLLVPYNYAIKVIQGRALFKIPFEINIVIDVIISSIICVMFFMSMMVSINGDAYRYLFNNYNIEPKTAFITIAVFNIAFLFFVYSFIFAGVTYIKYIFHTGPIKYYKNNSVFIIVIRAIKNSVKKMIDGIMDIDFNSKLDKSILKIVFINFVVLTGISIIWYFGVFAALVYSIFIFIIIRNYMMDIKNKYKILLKSINHIAEGNLNVKIDEDLGIFNPLKNQLKKIQIGLRKAVSKEVHSDRMKTELISNVSHDLKTPLTSIITYTDLLKHGNPTEEERKKYIDTIDKKSKRLKTLIEDLFDVSKATSGDIKLNKMDIDIIGLIKQTEIEYEDNLLKANLTVKNNFPSGKIILNVDGEKTYRIFANLLGNAVKYSIPNSRVYVDVNNYFDRVEIVMKNTSITEMNFSENEITERFVRGDKSRNTEGSGLGLAIVKSFTEIQNGKLNIKIDGDLFKAIVIFKK